MIGIILHGVAVLVFLVLGYTFPRDKQQGLLHRDLFVNVASGLLVFLIAKPIILLVKGYFDFHLLALPSQNPWIQLLICFVSLDFCRYWLHYAHHRVPFLWQFHSGHHSSERLDANSGLRMHIFDFFQLSLIPITLFGVIWNTEVCASWVIDATFGIGIFFDAFQHANLRFNLKNPFCRAWHLFLNNPHFHVWHHIRWGADADGNYGNTLIIWDRLFGTDVTEEYVPTELGLTEQKALKNNPLSLQLLQKRI